MQQKRNYQRELEAIIEENKRNGIVPKLFLHACCAPCSSYCLEYLLQYFEITVFYYNPNISPEPEYRKRVEELNYLLGRQGELSEHTQTAYPIHFIEGTYDPERFYQMAKGMETLPEGGERCFACYRLRLCEAAACAAKGKYDYYTTTLSISPHKNAQKLNEIGEQAGKEYGIAWLPSDFKKGMDTGVPVNYQKNSDCTGRIIVAAYFPKWNGKERKKRKNRMKTIYEAGAYHGFAFVYDMFMDNIPYDMWCDYIKDLLKKYNIDSGIVAELGCGTGNITGRLARYGYDMIGIDCSEDMLTIAREKMGEYLPQSSILYLQQDIRELELYGTAAAFLSVCDSMNYLLEEQDLLQVFRLVNNYLDADGIFIFDLKTEYYFERLGENTFAENRQTASFFWDNYYDRKTKINQYDLTVYVNEALLEEGETEEMEEPVMFFRFDETHYQRAYSLEEIKELLTQAGLAFVAAYDAFTEKAPSADSERIYIVAREKYQKNKRYFYPAKQRKRGEQDGYEKL